MVGRLQKDRWRNGDTCIYVFAHQDDWQLFRGEQAFLDMKTGNKIVFICMTAGNAGGVTPGNAGVLWKARERGGIASCRLAIDDSLDQPVPLDEDVIVNGHALRRCEYKNTVNYFFRIPEAGNSADGPLELLRRKNQPTTTVDGAATYASWGDLLTTLRTLVESERGGPHPCWINAMDPDSLPPPDLPDFRDNPDHIMVGHAVRDAGFVDYNHVWFLGYPIGAKPENLTTEQAATKRRLFMAYLTGSDDLMEDYLRARDIFDSWLPRSYFR